MRSLPALLVGLSFTMIAARVGTTCADKYFPDEVNDGIGFRCGW